MTPRVSPVDDRRGFALVIVLWLFVTLFALGAEFSQEMRQDAVATANFADETQSYYLASAAANLTFFRLLQQHKDQAMGQEPGRGPEGLDDGEPRPPLVSTDGVWHWIELWGAPVAVRVSDEGGKVAITRCGNLYGAGDLNWNRLIPGTIRSFARGERPIVRSDGSFVRDYFYVRDAVDAYLALAERLGEPKFHGEAFNFGTEEPKSVLEIVALLREAMGRADLEPVILNEASHEIPRQYLDCSKARAWLDWRPKRTLAQGLSETIPWYRSALA